EYFDRRQAGEDITPERFAAEHPDLADELRPYLDGLGLIENARALAGSGSDAEETESGARELPAVEGYELIEEIGRGGMGIVYKARQVSTERIVALKVMLAGPFASPIGRRRFQREVQLAARLQHPNIVRVLEGGHVAQQPYYAMDYVAGVRLDRYVSANHPDTRTTVELCAQICEAVEYAHGQNVVHRDLKPANVLIDDEGRPHILDFGLAKATDQSESDLTVSTGVSRPGEVVGTLAYLSPEQAAGTGTVDVRTDVYALGIMLFEVLTGSLPYDTSGRPSEVIQRVLETTPTPPSSLSERVDAELETIILKALEKEKQHRYRSAQEMADDIRRYLEGEPILARRPSSLYFLRKKLFKHRWVAAIATLALISILIGVLAESRSRQEELARARRSAIPALDSLEVARPGVQLGLAQAFRARHPSLLEAKLIYAHANYLSGYPDAAIGELERALSQDPSQWACRALLAELYQTAGNLERANELQAWAEREAPDSAEGWYLRSLATLDSQNALRCAEEAVKRQPSHALAWGRLTYLRRRGGDLNGALEGADRLIALGEDPRGWTVVKARVLSRQGRFREAIDLYTEMGAWVPRAHAYRRNTPRALRTTRERLRSMVSRGQRSGRTISGPPPSGFWGGPRRRWQTTTAFVSCLAGLPTAMRAVFSFCASLAARARLRLSSILHCATYGIPGSTRSYAAWPATSRPTSSSLTVRAGTTWNNSARLITTQVRFACCLID
ncbi:MAG: protein kinase domain-containing protein, partial [Planctomycetota bacterium]